MAEAASNLGFSILLKDTSRWELQPATFQLATCSIHWAMPARYCMKLLIWNILEANNLEVMISYTVR